MRTWSSQSPAEDVFRDFEIETGFNPKVAWVVRNVAVRQCKDQQWQYGWLASSCLGADAHAAPKLSLGGMEGLMKALKPLKRPQIKKGASGMPIMASNIAVVPVYELA